MNKNFLFLFCILFVAFKEKAFCEGKIFGEIDFCKQDVLDQEEAKKRIRWAHYHDFITAAEKRTLKDKGLYPYFVYKDKELTLCNLPKEPKGEFDQNFKDRKNIKIKGYCFVNIIKPLRDTPKENIDARCEFDKLSDEASMQGRINWAYKWGYLSYEVKSTLEKKNFYPVFVDAEGKFYKTPTSSDAPYVKDLSFIGPCIKGCFAGQQRVLFENKSIPVKQAYNYFKSNNIEPTVSSIRWNESKNKLETFEQSFRFTRGSVENELMFKIKTDRGTILEVTKEHPLVTEDHKVVEAQSLKIGMKLLGINGIHTIKSIQTFFLKGFVWNINPQSEKAIGNFLVLENVISGSVKFQNQKIYNFERLFTRLKF